MPTNTAAWIVAEKANPLEIKPADFTAPGDDEIVVKNEAIGLNLVDWATQALGGALFPWINYPTVLGSDVAGEVFAVGANVTTLKKGDRVTGMAVGLKTNRSADAAFQAYTVIPAHMASTIPAHIAYTDAAVLPLAVGTAAGGLFQKEYLALQLPTAPARPSTGETVLIWAGASSVGANAIQLAVAAGYEVFTTASPKNWDYLKRLGASQTFDYKSQTVVADIIHAFRGKKSAGALAIGEGVTGTCAEIVSQIGGKQFVASANMPPAELPDGVGTKFIFGSDVKDNEVGAAVFVDFVPKGLKDGSFVPAPPAEIVGHGLESIQEGLNMVVQGVSAKKYVVSL